MSLNPAVGWACALTPKLPAHMRSNRLCAQTCAAASSGQLPQLEGKGGLQVVAAVSRYCVLIALCPLLLLPWKTDLKLLYLPSPV